MSIEILVMINRVKLKTVRNRDDKIIVELSQGDKIILVEGLSFIISTAVMVRFQSML